MKSQRCMLIGMLKACREERDMPQREVSRLLKKQSTWWQRVESGKATYLDIGDFIAVCGVLHTKASSMILTLENGGRKKNNNNNHRRAH